MRMSNAWETTTDDVANVLRQHDMVLSEAELERVTEELDHDAIEKTVLHYCNMDTQTDAAYCEIEDQLMAKGVIPSANKKQWPMPTEDEMESDEDEPE